MEQPGQQRAGGMRRNKGHSWGQLGRQAGEQLRASGSRLWEEHPTADLGPITLPRGPGLDTVQAGLKGTPTTHTQYTNFMHQASNNLNRG